MCEVVYERPRAVGGHRDATRIRPIRGTHAHRATARVHTECQKGLSMSLRRMQCNIGCGDLLPLFDIPCCTDDHGEREEIKVGHSVWRAAVVDTGRNQVHRTVIPNCPPLVGPAGRIWGQLETVGCCNSYKVTNTGCFVETFRKLPICNAVFVDGYFIQSHAEQIFQFIRGRPESSWINKRGSFREYEFTRFEIACGEHPETHLLRCALANLVCR